MLRIHGLTLTAVLFIAFVRMAIADSLGSLTVTPSNSQAGQSAIYTLSFTTSSLGNGADVGIPKDGKIIVTFPAGFNLTGVNNAAPANGNMTGDFNLPTVVGNVVTLVRDGTGNDVLGDINVLVDFEFVTNATVVGNYQLTVETRTAADTGIDSGTSANFGITSGSLNNFLVEAEGGGSILAQTAGTPFSIRITARDVNNNTVTSFNGAGNTVNITSTGTLSSGSGTTAAFTNGVLPSHSVTISNTGSFTITATRTSGGSEIGTSNSFSVNPGTLNNFLVEASGGGNILTQTAGTAFSIRITARDVNGNTVTSFSGAGNTVNITSTGTLSSGSGTTAAFTNGVLSSHSVTISNSGTFTITATRTSGGTEFGVSNSFAVNSGALNNFLVEAGGGGSILTQTAGTLFLIRITARDVNGNTVTSFNGAGNTVNITSTGTLSSGSGTTAAFTNGVLSSHSVTISNTGSFTINATRTSGGTEFGVSNSFTVDAGALNNFLVEAGGGGNILTQTAGTPFSIRITARDVNGNTATSFNGAGNTVNITSTGTLSSGSGPTAAFTNGVLLSHSVTISNSGTFTITATRTSGGTEFGVSNSFAVNSGALNNFLVEAGGGGSILTQAAGTAFSIRITARDVNGNTVTSFNGAGNTVNITSTGTLSSGSGTTAAFTNGVLLSHSVTISNTGTFTITATRTLGGSEFGISNSFTVDAGALNNFLVEAGGGGNILTQTAGNAFSIRITARDANNNTVIGFTGTAQLTDDTGTLVPTVTGNFVVGVWTGNLMITKSQSNVRIRAQASGKQGFSNFFTVNPAALNNFGFAPISSPQVAGKKFFISITARDVYNNTVTGFASTVSLSVPGDTTLTPKITTNFVNGAWSDSVSLTKSQFGITITATQGAVNNPSNAFDVSPGPLDRFVFGPVTSPQTAGAQFSISITAVDLYSNILTAYADSVTLSDPFNTIMPKKIGGFINGAWSDNVAVTKADANTTILANASGKSGASALFEVMHAALNQFQITDIGDQTAGENFSVSITAQDLYLNTVLNFAETIGLQDSTGSISPTQTQAFSAGQWTDQVSITKSQPTRVTANFLGTVGQSNAFFINPAALNHFSIDSLGNQMAGVPFPITIRARDPYQNVVTSFASNVTLNDMTGTLRPRVIDGFQSGHWNGDVIIIDAIPSNQITVARSGGSENGSSNSFSLIPNLSILSIDASPAKVNRGQQGNLVTMLIENSGATGIDISSAVLTFTGTVNRTAQYVVTRTDNITSIAPATTQTLTFSVNVSPTASLELITIDGQVSGTILGIPVVDNSADSTDQWQVQSPATLSITLVDFGVAGVDTVSRGQTDLQVTMSVSNTGTADAQVTSTTLRFRFGAQDVSSSYIVSASNEAIIAGGASSNIDIVVNVGSTAPTGLTIVDGVIRATDINTGAIIADSSAATTDQWEVVEAPIIAFNSIVPSQNFVTLGQSSNWNVIVTVENNGGSDVRLENASLSLIIGANNITGQFNIVPPTAFVNSGDAILEGNGGEDQLRFTFTSNPNVSQPLLGEASIQGHLTLTDLGTNEPITPNPSSSPNLGGFTIQTPANLRIASITPSQPRVNTGQLQDWDVTVRLVNDGQSDVRLDTVAAATKISFSLANDFDVAFKNFTGDANLTLRGNSNADLVYTVRTSSNQTGPNVISAEIAWVELNSNRRVVFSGQGPQAQSVIVQTPGQLLIESTQTPTPNVFVGSPIPINVTVRNSGEELVRNISVDLTSNGISDIVASPLSIDSLNGGQNRIVRFDVQADALASVQEIFTAKILQGTGNNTRATVTILTPLDSTTTVNIDSRLLSANSSILSPSGAQDSVVSTGQTFTLATRVDFDDRQIHDVQAILDLPDGYSANSNLTQIIATKGDTAKWIINAPLTAIPGPSVFSIHAEGKNDLDETIPTSPNDISIRTVTRAQVRVVSFVAEPVGARSIRVGEQFEIQVELENDGDAAMNNPVSVRLAFESPAYSTTDNLTQLFAVGSPASWTIQAPSQPTLASKIYCIMSASGLPNDENGVQAVALNDTSELTISTIVDTSLSFSNYPNPFGNPGRGRTTRLYYYLSKDTDVQIRIYSLLGELVWQRSFKATDPYGREGAHEDLQWDATNGNGEVVLNGVYIAHITTGDGQQATRKIAVVK